MNKRQKKKFEKKLFCKTYYGCRQRKLSLLAERYDVGENDILYTTPVFIPKNTNYNILVVNQPIDEQIVLSGYNKYRKQKGNT